MAARGRIRRWGSLVAVLALLVTACGGAAGPTDPTEALVDAVERSFSGAFAFEVQIEMDEAARAKLPSGDVPFGALLDSLEITGHTAGQDTLALTVAAMGQDLFELRQTDVTHIYLRTDAGRIAETFGAPLDHEEILAEAQQAPEAVGQMLTGLLDGRWVGIVGEPAQGPDPDAMMLMGGVDPSEMQAAQREAFGDSPAEFARRFTTAAFADSDADGRVLDVRLLTQAMAEAMYTTMLAVYGDEHRDDEQMRRDLERIPETVGGIAVEVSNRLVDRVAVDVFEVVRSLDGSAGDEPAGSLRLVADISEHGTAGPVAAPDDALTVAAEDLGQHHPGAFLPLGGLGSGMMWPLMWLMPMGMTSSVESVETSVELHAPSAEVTAVPALPPGHPSAVPPAPPEMATAEAVPPMSLDVDPYAGPAGSRVTITVEGFADGPVEVRWDDREGPVLATAEGPDFTVEVTVPADTTPGQHTIVIEATSPDSNRGAAVSFEVTEAE